MEYTYADGLIDWITGSTYSVPSGERNMEPVAYRVKMKEGVDTLDMYPIQGNVWAVDYGTGDGVDRTVESGRTVGEYVTMFMRPAPGVTYTQGDYITADFSAFFSQFEIVYDPLPQWIRIGGVGTRSITIDSVDFQAPRGVLDRSEAVFIDFSGSTFRVAPRVYSDLAMRETEVYPIAPDNSKNIRNRRRPFADCPNLERIEYQGDLQNVLVVGPIDLTYQDENGNDVFDAYPEGGAPTVIRSYIESHGNPISLSTRFPKFDTSRLQFLSGHLDVGPVQFTGAPELPFGGLDFTDAKMLERLELPELEFDTSDSFGDGATITWASLGVSAPVDSSLKWVTGLWDIYNILPDRSEFVLDPVDAMEMVAPVIRPGSTQAGLHGAWVSQLEAVESVLNVDDNFVPVVPPSVEVMNGYYRKHIVGGGAPSASTNMYDHAVWQTYQDDDDSYAFIPPRLHSGVRRVNGYCDSLFAFQVILDDIDIPALPSSVEVMRDGYRRIFYNAKGEIRQIAGRDVEPNVVVAWSESGSARSTVNMSIAIDPPRSEGDDNGLNAWRAIYERGLEVDTDQYGNEPLFELYRDGNTPFSPELGLDQGAQRETVYYGHGALPPYEDVMDELYSVTQASTMTRMIESDIVLEHGTYPVLSYSSNFQQEAFYGAFVDPTEVEMYIPLPQASEWGAYNNTGIYRTVYRTVGGQNWSYSGVFWVDHGVITINLQRVNFVAMAVYGNYEEADLAEFYRELNNVEFAGSPRTPAERVISPYSRSLSGSLDGDFESFKNQHGIDSSIGVVGESAETPSVSSGLPVVINASAVKAFTAPWITNWNVFEIVPYGSRYPNDQRNDASITQGAGYIEWYINENVAAPRIDLVQRDTNWNGLPFSGHRDVQGALNDMAANFPDQWDSGRDLVDYWNNYFQFDRPIVIYPERLHYLSGRVIVFESQQDIDDFNN